MKTTILEGLLCLLVLVGCNSKENHDLNFKDFNLDLSGLDLDFTKPQVQTYSSDVERDSIVAEIATEVFEIDATSVGEKDSKIIFLMLDFSQESKTATAQLILNEKEIDLTSWKEMIVCNDADCLNNNMNKIISENPSASFAIRRDLINKKAQLFYKNE